MGEPSVWLLVAWRNEDYLRAPLKGYYKGSFNGLYKGLGGVRFSADLGDSENQGYLVLWSL